MRVQLETELPTLQALAGTAQQVPLPSASLDAVVCAQAFHWFATRDVLGEFHRVIKPAAPPGLVWNVRDDSVDWVAQLTRIVTPHEGDALRFYIGDWRRPFPYAGFGPLVKTRLRYQHIGTPQQAIIDRFLWVSFIAALPLSDNAAVRESLETPIATHPELRGRETVTFPCETVAFPCIRLS